MDDFEGCFEKKICRFIRAQIKRHIFFSNNPSKSSKNWFFPNFFYIFLLIFVCKLQKIWVSDLRRNLGCAPYAQSWVYFENFEKTPNFGRMVRTLDYTSNLKLLFSEAYTQRSIGICEKNEEKSNFWLILNGVLKKKYATSLGLNVT